VAGESVDLFGGLFFLHFEDLAEFLELVGVEREAFDLHFGQAPP
jgi:hypothetical protein